MSDVLSVGIYRDASFPDINTSIGLDGVALVNEYAGNLDVVFDDATIDVTPNTEGEAGIKSFDWGELKARLNIVLTERPLPSHEGKTTLGLGHSAFLTQRKGVALVWCDQSPDVAAYTASHEVGHTLSIKHKKPQGIGYDDHCADESCLMYPVLFSAKHDVSQEQKSALETWFGASEDEEASDRLRGQDDFCGHCARILGNNATLLSKWAKGKITLPNSFPR